jgi:hypothetical protein
MNGESPFASIFCRENGHLHSRNVAVTVALKKFNDQIEPMSSSSSRRAQALRQHAVISGQENEPIPFSPFLIASKCQRYLEELLLGSDLRDIIIDSTFDRDSVVQFVAACQGKDFNLTLSNVFEIEVLCDEWSVVGKSIRRKVTEFIEHKGLGLRRLLFQLGRGLVASETEELLRANLSRFICDSAAFEIPVAVLARIVDFKDYEDRSDEYERLFKFCVEYVRARGSSASQILRTLDVTRLNTKDLGRLCATEQLNWSVLNQSVVQSLFAMRKEVEQQRKEIEDLRNDIGREQSANVAMKAIVDRQRQKIEELEEASQRQKRIIARQVSEIKGLKAAKNRCEDELKRSTEANEGQERELRQLKDGNKAMEARNGVLCEEVAELTNLLKRAVLHPDQTNASEVIQRIFPESKQFPPSMKKGEQFDVPDGIIAHLTRECGGNVHDCHMVEVTSGSFEKETCGANPHSGAFDNNPEFATKNAADLETDSRFWSAYRESFEDIPHMKNNWVCYNFKERKIVPTHYAIRTNRNGPDLSHLKSWLVETSADGKIWREVAREEDNNQLNGPYFTGTFAVVGRGECRFIRLVNIGRNHIGTDCIWISAWEIFGCLIK